MSAFERPTDDREDGALAAYELSNRDCDEGGTCPLNSGKVQLLPLRYGLVEELEPGCATPYTLSARPLGIRLVRNGYLYVLDGETNEVAEYVLSEQGNKISGGKLEYDTDRTLYVCFSEVAWTDAKRAQVLDSEDDRDAFMQAVDLSGANPIDGGGEHLITTAQAEAWVAEFAEETEREPPEGGHEQEGEAYHWENDHYYHKSRLGKLLKQHDVEDRDECLCLIVRDDIGVMRDLAQFQDNVVGWLEEWAEEEEGKTERDYVLGCYIESITQLTADNMQQLAPGEEGSPEQALWQDLEALDEESRANTQQAILDYLNEEQSLPASHSPDLPAELRESIIEIGKKANRANAYAILQEQQEAVRRYYAKQSMRNGDPGYIDKHVDTITDMKRTNNRRVRDMLEGASFGQRGINDLVNRTEMDAFLSKQRPKLARWNELLSKISRDRASMLCSSYFHLAAWYFDANDEAQVEAAFSAEYACTRDICRDDDVIERINQWLTEHPEYDRPLFHTRSLEEQAALIKDYTALFAAGYGVITNIQSWIETLTQAEQGKLPDVSALPDSLQALAHGVQSNLSPAMGIGFAKIMEQIQQATGQSGFTLPDLEDLFRQLNPPTTWARIVDAARINQARFVVSAASLDELMRLVQDTLRMRQQLTSLNNRRQQASGRERRELNAQRRELQSRLTVNEQNLAAALSPVGEAGANDLMLSQGGAGSAGLVVEFDDAAKAVAVGRVTSNLRQGIYRAPPAALLGDGVGLLVFVGQAVGLWGAVKVFQEARSSEDNSEKVQAFIRLSGSVLATSAAGFLAAQSIGDTALQAQARALANAANASRSSGVSAQLGRMHFALGSIGYFVGFWASGLSLNNNRNNWQDAVRSGNANVQGGAALAMMGDAGLMGAQGYGLYSTISTRLAVRGGMTWAMAGSQLASVFWRFNAIGLAFSVLQLGGTWLYNRHNISEHDQWLLTSPWGTEEGNESLEHYLDELRRISQAAHITLEEVYAESWRPNWMRSPDHYQVALHLPGLAPEALHPPLVGLAPVRLSLKAWQVQPIQIWQREGTVRAPEHWLEATSELAEALALGTDGDKGHVVLSGLAPDHRQTPHGYGTEHWVVGARLEHLDGEGRYQASDVYIYIDPRGGAGSGKRYMPSDFPRRGGPGSWYAISE
ncbi:toxin VasX [Vreelandella stevensii]|uniref:toxin VasX n=1 Tax=Vreelandella stevensii TaxID=502821 RepID=UPI00403B24EB